MKNFKIERIDGVSSEVSSMWFLDDDDIRKFMGERSFREVSGTTGMSFVPFQIEAFISFGDKNDEYELVLQFSDGKVTVDFGKALHIHDDAVVHTFRLTGRIIEDCTIVCRN